MNWDSLLVAPVALLLCATGLTGQRISEPTPKQVCFYPAPEAYCASYLLFELRWNEPFVHPPRRAKKLSHWLAVESGASLNIARDWSIGATVGAGIAGESSHRYTAGGRLRWWATDDIAIELAPGTFQLVGHGTRRDERRTGYNLATRLMLADIGVLGVRYDRLGIAPDATVSEPGGFDSTLSAEFGLEAKWGVFGTAFIGLLYAVAVGVAIGGIG